VLLAKLVAAAGFIQGAGFMSRAAGSLYDGFLVGPFVFQVFS
jgi:hypothetical protein